MAVSARRRAHVPRPYFLPGRELLSALHAAALRSVAIDVILHTRSRSRRIIIEELQARPFPIGLRDAVAKLLSLYL